MFLIQSKSMILNKENLFMNHCLYNYMKNICIIPARSEVKNT